MAPYALIQAT